MMAGFVCSAPSHHTPNLCLHHMSDLAANDTHHPHAAAVALCMCNEWLQSCIPPLPLQEHRASCDPVIIGSACTCCHDRSESASHWQQQDYKAFSPAIDSYDKVDWNSAPAIQVTARSLQYCYSA